MNDFQGSALDNILAIEPITDIAPSDQMFQGNHRHYFGVGRSALLAIASAFTARTQFNNSEGHPQSILDYGCGHGRVARFIRAAFPPARLEVTDYSHDGVTWCIDHLGCHDMGEGIPSDYYDLIWVGSVFTHLPQHKAVSLIANLKASLRPFGILIYTTHGRVTTANLEASNEDSQPNRYGIDNEGAGRLIDSYHRTGFGYCDYPHQTNYGIAAGKPGWFIDRTSDERTLLLFAQERGWDTHQDVLSFLRTPANVESLDRGRWYPLMSGQLAPR
jgi:SAM-dependent methyltransferase